MKFNVTIKDFEKGKEDTVNKMRLVLQKSMFKMEELAIDYAPHDQGGLRENITLFPQILSNQYILTSNMPYSEALEFGNTPAQVDIEDIEAWAKRKDIVSGDDVYPFAKSVAEKIRTKGVNKQSFLRPALQQVRDFHLPLFKKEVFNP